jgi:hypothetical protein
MASRFARANPQAGRCWPVNPGEMSPGISSPRTTPFLATVAKDWEDGYLALTNAT